ncbi:protein of unknown function (DUF748) [Mariprofundus ferrinatatus]|uniref:DUF748 domain-containing protein n=1 Tax=Mariprofundus ferrinatatus TaxID=1921087 RepID=A0A2K8L9J8_9PROT|nr:DUF748 domain-containing protein [Mariprofundus ferrinatatus]ATX82561.1 protein of unknown function (DUF748) [Mariprofundus ferrinatatus]
MPDPVPMPEEPPIRRIRRRFIVLYLFVALVSVMLTMLPLVVHQVALSWLEDHGVTEARVDNIDINILVGAFVIEGLQAGDGLKIDRLGLAVDWWPLSKNHIHVVDLNITGSTIHLQQNDQGGWQLGDIKLPATAEESAAGSSEVTDPWYAVVDKLTLEDVTVKVNGKAFVLNLPVKNLELHLSAPDGGVQLLAQSLQTGSTNFSGYGYKVGLQSLDFSGDLSFSAAAGDITESLKVENTSLAIKGVGLADEQGAQLLSLADFNLSGLAVRQMKEVAINSLALQRAIVEAALTGAGRLSLGSMQAGGLEATLREDRTPSAIRLADLSLKRFDVEQQQGSTAADHITLGSLHATGLATKLGAASAPESIRLALIELRELAVRQQKGAEPLGTIGMISLKQFGMQGSDRGTFDSLKLQQVSLPSSGNRSLGSIGTVTASKAEFDEENGYRLQLLEVDQLKLDLLKRNNGKMAVLDELESKPAAARPEPAKKSVKAKSAKGDPVVIVERLQVNAGSYIRFRDESVRPAMDTSITVSRFTFAPLDLSGKRSGRLDVRTRVGKAGRLNLGGRINPSERSFMTDLTVSLKSFDMPRLTGYLEGDFGKTIDTGQLSLDSRIGIKKSVIDAKNTLMIRKLTLGDSDKKGEKAEEIGMPINMALDMLRDDRGDIELDVPITGDLNDPNINISDAINQALASALSAGALTMATMFLQPYGAIMMAADLAGDALSSSSKPKLTPVQFAPMATSLNAEMGGYVGKIGELLNSKPLRLQICGFATSAEGAQIAEKRKAMSAEAIEAWLLEMAEARSDFVMNALLQKGIDSERLFNCRAQIDKREKGAGPRVDLLLD